MNNTCMRKQPAPMVEVSLICLDLCNLEAEVKRIAEAGVKALHIDLLDGTFSPSMPLGLDTIKQLRQKTDLDFDVHLMTHNNDFFMDELLGIGIQSMSFHIEAVEHADIYLEKIKKAGVKAGVALKPATTLHELDYILGECDFVLQMLINPGYADKNDVSQVAYAKKKIQDLRAMIEREAASTKISIDGRVSWTDIFEYSKREVDIFVAGSTCLKDNFAHNLSQIG